MRGVKSQIKWSSQLFKIISTLSIKQLHTIYICERKTRVYIKKPGGHFNMFTLLLFVVMVVFMKSWFIFSNCHFVVVFYYAGWLYFVLLCDSRWTGDAEPSWKAKSTGSNLHSCRTPAVSSMVHVITDFGVFPLFVCSSILTLPPICSHGDAVYLKPLFRALKNYFACHL